MEQLDMPMRGISVCWKGLDEMNEHYPFELTPLPYDYSALEPYIDAMTVMLHHDAHQGTYVKNLNAALACAPDALKCLPLERLITDAPNFPPHLRCQILRNAGGVYAHELYFDGMTPCPSSHVAVGRLAAAIDCCFGSFETFQKQMTEVAEAHFGSGWAWLVCCPDGGLRILSTVNQDIPLSFGLRPILTVDVWEHAYYLKYHNKRADYIAAWWNVVDWEFADLNYMPYKNC